MYFRLQGKIDQHLDPLDAPENVEALIKSGQEYVKNNLDKRSVSDRDIRQVVSGIYPTVRRLLDNLPGGRYYEQAFAEHVYDFCQKQGIQWP